MTSISFSQRAIVAPVGANFQVSHDACAPHPRWGRRPLIVAAGVCYVAGSALLAVAPGFHGLLVGRLALGVGVGLSSIAVPVYLAEVAPPSCRGRVVSCYTLSIVGGQAAACVVNIAADAWLPAGLKWRVSLGLAAGPALLLLAGFACLGLPESPKWLAGRGRALEAHQVLARLRGRGKSGGSGGGSGGTVAAEEEAAQLELAWQALLALPEDDVGDVQVVQNKRGYCGVSARPAK